MRGSWGRDISHIHSFAAAINIRGKKKKKRSNLTWNGPVYHSYIRRLHFIHQSLLWCLISLVTQERPTLHIIKDWWGVLVKDRGRRSDWLEKGTLCVTPSLFRGVESGSRGLSQPSANTINCSLQMLYQAWLLLNLKTWPWYIQGGTCKCGTLRSLPSYETQEAQDKDWAFHLRPSALFHILPCNAR